jgi:hypothetical protein
MKESTKQVVRTLLFNCVKDTLTRIKSDDGDYRPFHSRLLSNEIIKRSKFERSFSTSFGQKSIEQISKAVASDVDGTSECETQHTSNISISKARADAIEEHITKLRHNSLGREPDWIKDTVFPAPVANESNFRIISDLWFIRDGIDYFFSIKTVKPNIDQTSEAKRDMMKLLASKSTARVYFALPYNPYGESKDDYAHSPPFKIFNMTKDSCVLIGEEYWDLIGGKGTYNEILAIAEQVGIETKKLLLNL